MVRVNIIPPKNLTDQHLIAEYNEMLMLATYIRNHPNTNNIPKHYTLGKGHMKFFKNKVLYLKNRHNKIKNEMKKRGFKTNKSLNIKLNKSNNHNYTPTKQDLNIIKPRLRNRVRMKPTFYRYYKKHKPLKYLIQLLK